MDTAEIFDRTARRHRRDRAAADFGAHDFLRAAMLEGIEDRLSSIKREFADILDLGCFDGSFAAPAGSRVARMDPGAAFARAARGVQADEDRPPFADGAFDLIVSAGVLDTVNDLPGALTLARRMLRPDGVFLAAFLGGDSLATLRSLLLAAEHERPAARAHPRIDVRSGGDLLVRAGFALPVADSETVRVRYRGLLPMLHDLRGMAATNVLAERAALGRDAVARAGALFDDRADADGRLSERFDLIFLTGWAPAPSQPQPARRGSGTASLAAALRAKT